MITHPNRGRLPDPVKLAAQLDAAVKRVVAALALHEARYAARKPTDVTAGRLQTRVDAMLTACGKLKERAARSVATLSAFTLLFMVQAHAQVTTLPNGVKVVPLDQVGPLGSVPSTINLGPILDVLMPLLLSALVGVIGAVAKYARDHAKTAEMQGAITNVQAALDAGAGLAYKYAVAHEGGFSNLSVHNGALATGANYALNAVVNDLKKVGLTPDDVQSRVEARVGVLLAGDPSVSSSPTAAAVLPPVLPSAAPGV